MVLYWRTYCPGTYHLLGCVFHLPNPFVDPNNDTYACANSSADAYVHTNADRA